MLRAQQLDFRNFKSLRLFAIFVGLICLGTLMLPSRNIDDEPGSLLYKPTNNMKIQVHLDLKGAAPKIEFYEPLFKFFADLKIDSVLLEYEDTFPFFGKLADLKAANAYTPDDIKFINQTAAKYSLELIPLVQVCVSSVAY